jgi:hypothetical protein
MATRKRRRKSGKVVIRRKVRKISKLSHGALIELIELLVANPQREKRKKTRRRKEKTDKKTATNAVLPTVQSSSYSTAVAKEKQATEFSAQVQHLKEKEQLLLRAAEKAQPLAIAYGHTSSNGTLPTPNQIIALKKSEGISISMEQARHIFQQMQHDQNQIRTLSQDVLHAQQDLQNLITKLDERKLEVAALEVQNDELNLQNLEYTSNRKKLIYDEWKRPIRAIRVREVADAAGVTGLSAINKEPLIELLQDEDWFKAEFGEPNYNDLNGAGIQPHAGDPTGLTDVQINEAMRKHKRYAGTFAADEMSTIPISSTFGFIMNTEPRAIHHGHWIAVYVDSEDAKAVEYFDPFGEEPNETFMKALAPLVEQLDCDEYLKLKINRIKVQDITTDTCGWHSMKFLTDRFSGKPFREITGFDDSIRGEADVEKLKQKYKVYGYI